MLELGDVGFRCPSCRDQLRLEEGLGRPTCVRCGSVVGTSDGVLDFVSEPDRAAERAYYEREYVGMREGAGPTRSIQSLAPEWQDFRNIPNRRVWQELGSLRGKRVVALGNGASDKELFFLTEDPEALVLSDLSAEAMRVIRDRYRLDEHAGQIYFAAIDGLDLPFVDEALDVVYGYGFVHHLPDYDRFFAESARVLRPGGRAVFMDDAYAPLWQAAKLTVLRPLMRYTHRRNPISPEDMRCTMAGGFREDDMARRIRAVGCEPWFHREAFLYFFWTRASERLFPKRLMHLGQHVAVARTLIKIDERLERYGWVRRNLIRLVWGFDKPARPETSVSPNSAS